MKKYSKSILMELKSNKFSLLSKTNFKARIDFDRGVYGKPNKININV